MRNYMIRNDRTNGYDLFDDAFESFFKPEFNKEKFDSMKTDVKETDTGYEMGIEVPGFDKKDINVALEDGYLTISANKKEVEDNNGGKKSNYLRRERNYSCSRSYYVGDVKEKDIKAKYENGILNIFIPKEQPKELDSHLIEIE